MGMAARRRMSVLVALLLVAITAGLTVLTWEVTEHSEQRLLDRQLDQVGTLLTTQAAVLRVQLADIAQVAVNTEADPDVFARWAAGELTRTGQSLSLWRTTDSTAEQVAVQGVEPLLPDGGPDVLSELEPTGDLVILGIVSGSPDRLAYALMPAQDNTDLVIYAESPLAPDRRMQVTPDSPVEGLDLALYLGSGTEPEQLLQSTAPLPIRGDTRTTSVPFGSAEVTIVGASPTPLTGALASALPWIVLGAGLALAATGAATLEYVSRRRTVAEGLAAENERLYREQRGIAGTLQNALLPTVPAVAGVEVAARYVAGVDALEVGGDWFDVITRGPGCVVFVVGDVSGRGLPAATTMAALRFAVRAYLAEGHDIAAVLTRLRGLLDVDVDHQFATVLLGELDARAGRVRLVSAGHFAPVLVSGGRARLLDCPLTPPIGVGTAAGPEPSTVTVSGPATLLAFTDGLVERSGEVIDTGLERLVAAAAEADSRPLTGTVDDVLATLTAGGGKDDTVLLGMRWTR
ncbi:PP2C family protein-serine/threonine phosphatase [Geodermatophilus sp. SYSU D01186]